MKLSHPEPTTMQIRNLLAKLKAIIRVGSGDLLGVWSNISNPVILADGKRINRESNDAYDQSIYANLETNPEKQSWDNLHLNRSCFDCGFYCLRHPTIYLYLGIAPNDPSNTRKCKANPSKLKNAQMLCSVTLNPPAHGNRYAQQPGCQCNNAVAKLINRFISHVAMLYFDAMYRVHIRDAKTPNEKS